MIINWEYFFGERAIPSITKDDVKDTVNLFIAKYEPKLLECLLGRALYVEFTAGLVPVPVEPPTDPVTYEPIAQKWLNLRDGCDYVDKYGNATHWFGIINSTTKESLIANYVYYKYIGDLATATTASGERKTTDENSLMASPIVKQTRAWNEMIEWNKQLRLFLQSSTNVYDTWNDPLMRPRYCECTELFKRVNAFNF